MTSHRGWFNESLVGAPVVGPDGDDLGTVKEVGEQRFKVDAPMQPDYWLDVEVIRSIDDGRVTIGYGPGGRAPHANERAEGAHAGSQDSDEATTTDRSGGQRTRTGHETAQAAGHVPEPSETAERGQRMELREEELRVRKEMVETGEVTIRKEVVTEYRTMKVPVRREELVIERHPAEGGATSESIGAGEAIRVPLREEAHIEREGDGEVSGDAATETTRDDDHLTRR